MARQQRRAATAAAHETAARRSRSCRRPRRSALREFRRQLEQRRRAPHSAIDARRSDSRAHQASALTSRCWQPGKIAGTGRETPAMQAATTDRVGTSNDDDCSAGAASISCHLPPSGTRQTPGRITHQNNTLCVGKALRIRAGFDEKISQKLALIAARSGPHGGLPPAAPVAGVRAGLPVPPVRASSGRNFPRGRRPFALARYSAWSRPPAVRATGSAGSRPSVTQR